MVSESGYTGQFAAVSSSTKVATVSPSSIQATARERNAVHVDTVGASFTVLGTGYGTALISIGDQFGNTARFNVTVTSPTPTPSASPTPTPTPGTVTLTSPALNFTATGAAYAQTTMASQTNYSGPFAASTATCNGIATISPSSGTTFTVVPVAAGSCTFAITGGNGQTAALAVGVTTTTVGGS